MKLLIVDDESIVRVGIKSIVQNARINIEMIEEATNGASALDITRRILPDIVLVDIRMPVMDGLTYIKEARSLIPTSKFIILSCLNEFNFVKSAMKLGVSDYIIKTTIDSDELVQVLEKARNDILQAREAESQTLMEHTQNVLNKPLVIQSCLNKMLDGCLQPKPLLESVFNDIGMPFDSSEYCLVVGTFDRKAAASAIKPNSIDLLSFAIRNICQDIYRRYCHGYTFSRDGGYIVSLLVPDSTLGSNYTVSSILHEVIASANEYLGESISFGVSHADLMVSDFSSAFDEAVAALQNKFYTGSGSVTQYPILYREALLSDPESTKNRGAAVIKALFTMNEDEFDKAMDGMFEYLLAEPHFNITDVKSFFCRIVFDLFEQFKDMGIKLSLNEIETEKILNSLMSSVSFADLLTQFRAFSGKLLNAAREYGNKHFIQLIQNIKTYIRSNIDKDISLADTAEYVKMNPSYVSKIFKLRTGESFSDFVRKEKIILAKELIINNEKIYSISEKLGYADIASFSRAFKNTEGISPQQYKKLMIDGTPK